MRTALFAPTALALAAFACSSESPSTPAPLGDAGPDDARGADADVPEPAWSGVTVEPGCTANGCIRALTEGDSYPKAVLDGLAAPGNVVENGMRIFAVRYMSDGDEVTGTIGVPDTEPPAGGYPVAVVNQFTSGIGAPCAPSAGRLGVGVVSPLATRGVLTIAPDATSYGPGPVGVYLAARPAGRAALDAARAAFHLGPALGKPVARRAVVAGHSQGGHSTMAAAAELLRYAPHLEVRGFLAVAPPSAFRSATNAIFRAGTGFGGYTAMRLHTWQAYFGLGGEPVLKEPYRTKAEGRFAAECLFVGSDGKQGTLLNDWPSNPADIVSDPYLAMGKDDRWTDGWAAAYDDSNPIPKGVTLPIAIFQGSADTTVTPAETDAYVKLLRDAGVTVDYRTIAGAVHGDTALVPFTVEQKAGADAVAWLKDVLAR